MEVTFTATISFSLDFVHRLKFFLKDNVSGADSASVFK